MSLRAQPTKHSARPAGATGSSSPSRRAGPYRVVRHVEKHSKWERRVINGSIIFAIVAVGIGAAGGGLYFRDQSNYYGELDKAAGDEAEKIVEQRFHCLESLKGNAPFELNPSFSPNFEKFKQVARGILTITDVSPVSPASPLFRIIGTYVLTEPYSLAGGAARPFWRNETLAQGTCEEMPKVR